MVVFETREREFARVKRPGAEVVLQSATVFVSVPPSECGEVLEGYRVIDHHPDPRVGQSVLSVNCPRYSLQHHPLPLQAPSSLEGV